jgi:hypothetical protein
MVIESDRQPGSMLLLDEALGFLNVMFTGFTHFALIADALRKC